MLRSLDDQPTTSMHAQFDMLLDSVTERRPAVAERPAADHADLLAFAAFPDEHSNKEI